MIRLAVLEDIPDICRMATEFYKTTSYANLSKIPLNYDDVVALAELMINAQTISVAVIEGKVHGMIGLVVIPFVFNADYMHAGEIVWWVDDEVKGTGMGRALLDAAETMARDVGAVHIQMVDLISSGDLPGKIYTSAGYQLTERSYTKVL